MDITQQGIVLLLRSAVTGEKAALPEGFSLEMACQLLRRQSVLLLGWQGACNCGIPPVDPQMQQLIQQYYRQLLRSERQLRAVEQLFQVLEAENIAYLPVKGCLLKQLYPKPELRAMGDADILIHPEDHIRLAPRMEDMGYQLRSDNAHVFYWHSDALAVELHKSLIPPDDSDFYDYYGTGWHLAQLEQGCRYRLRPEDHYIFLIVHFARHYRLSGIGCRHVTDLYVFRRQYPQMDLRYVEAELEKLHLLEFHGNVCRLLRAWFEDGQPDAVTELMTAFVFSGGNWGTEEALLYAQEVRSAGKQSGIHNTVLRSAIRSVFPPVRAVRERYQILDKAPYLLPGVWVAKWLDILLFRREAIGRKSAELHAINDSSVLSHKEALLAVGLDFSHL